MPHEKKRPYRRGVGAVLFDGRGRVFVGRRRDAPDAWQMPQGGIDVGETPRAAVLRELREEIGTAKARIIGESRGWLAYDLPPTLAAKAWGGRYRGQKQKWFALRFLGRAADIRLDAGKHPEFDAWKWVRLEDLPRRIVAFKRPLYENLVAEFSRLAPPGGGAAKAAGARRSSRRVGSGKMNKAERQTKRPLSAKSGKAKR